MNHTPFWTRDEAATLDRMHQAGATNAEIAEALPGRSTGAVRRRRQDIHGKRQRRGKVTGPAPLLARIAALESTVAAAMARGDWDYVDELLQGLEYLSWKSTQVEQEY